MRRVAGLFAAAWTASMACVAAELSAQHRSAPRPIAAGRSLWTLTDIARSYRAHGFKDLILIGDSGGNQPGMRNVAAALKSRTRH